MNQQEILTASAKLQAALAEFTAVMAGVSVAQPPAPAAAQPGLYTIAQFAKRNHEAGRYPGNERAIRHLLFNAQQNGLEDSGAIARLGRRILIDEQKFFAWAARQSRAA